MQFFQTKSFSAWILSFICIAALLGFYVFQINQMAETGYLIENCEERINKLSLENKNLAINFARVNSLENIEQMVNSLNFEKQGQISYIRIIESAVAAK